MHTHLQNLVTVGPGLEPVPESPQFRISVGELVGLEDTFLLSVSLSFYFVCLFACLLACFLTQALPREPRLLLFETEFPLLTQS